MRRQNKETDKKDASRTFAPPDPGSDDLNKWIVYDKEGSDSNGYNINGIKRDGYDINGYNINGYDNFGFSKDGYNINDYDFLGLDRDGYNINGVKGIHDYKDKYAYNQYGFNKHGFNKNGYNRDGYNEYGFNRNGLNENRLNKYGKRNIPGLGLKILTPQQMLARLPILLAQIKAGNNSLELKNEIRQLLYSLYRSKQISKMVYKNLIATI